MSEQKETQYFCSDFHKESDCFHGRKKYFPYRTEESYLNLFEPNKIVGESSVWHLYSKVAARRIHKFNPRAKIIIMLREPSEMIYSLHAQLLYSTDEDVKDFSKAIDIEPQRKNLRNIPKNCHFPSMLYYMEVAKYYDQIKRYLDYFSKEQVKIILFDDFKEDTEAVFQDVLKFLKVDLRFKPSFDVKNASKKSRSNFLKKILKNPDIPLKEIIKKILPKKGQNLIYSRLIKLNTLYSKRSHMNARTRKKIIDEHREDIKRISKLLEKDLVTIWKY